MVNIITIMPIGGWRGCCWVPSWKTYSPLCQAIWRRLLQLPTGQTASPGGCWGFRKGIILQSDHRLISGSSVVFPVGKSRCPSTQLQLDMIALDDTGKPNERQGFRWITIIQGGEFHSMKHEHVLFLLSYFSFDVFLQCWRKICLLWRVWREI